MAVNIIKQIRLWLDYAVGLLTILACFIVLSHKAFAGPQTSYNLAYIQDVAIYGPNSGLEAPWGHYLVEAGTNSTGTLTLTCKGTSGGYPGLAASMSGNPTKSCSGNQSITFSVSGTQTLTVQKTGGEGHQPFTLSVTGSSPLITHLDDPNDGNPTLTDPERNSYGFSLWMTNDVSFDFTEPCGSANGNQEYIKWFDADEAGYTGAYAIIWNEDTGNAVVRQQLGGNGQASYLGFTAQPGTHYAFEMIGAGTVHNAQGNANAMQFVLPHRYSPGLTCGPQWTVTPHTLFSTNNVGPGQVVKITHWVHNNGPDTASFNWTVQGSYQGNSFANSRCGNTNPDGSLSNGAVNSSNYNSSTSCRSAGGLSSGSSTLQYTGSGDCGTSGNTNCIYETYVFPANAPPGATYCQHIFVNPSSSSGGTATSRGGCVTLRSGTTRWVIGTCDEVDFGVGMAYRQGNNQFQSVRYNIRYYNQTTGASGYLVQGGSAPNNAVVSYSLPDHNQIMSGILTYTVDYYNVVSGRVVYLGTSPSVANVGAPQGCYEANCTLNIVPGYSPWGNNDFEGGQTFLVSYTVTNVGSNTINDPMSPNYPYNISATTSMDGNPATTAPHYISDTLDPGETSTAQTFSVTAPGDTNTHTIIGYPDYYGRGIINSDGNYRCSTSFNSFEPFNITGNTPTAIPQDRYGTPNYENPVQITKSFSWQNTTQWSAPSTVTTNLYGDPPGAAQYSGAPIESDAHPGIYGSGSYTHTLTNLGNWTPGYQYCPQTVISASVGYVGPGYAELGDPSGPTPFTPTPATVNGPCAIIVNEPYIDFYGSDVAAGMPFSGGSPSPNTGIYTYSNSSSTPLSLGGGSGTQFAAMAVGAIEGFASADLSSTAPMGLTFANTTNTGGAPPNANMGGNLANASDTITDYFANMPPNVTTISGFNAAQDLNHAVYYAGGSTFTIPTTTLADGSKTTIYVNGNVHITGNIADAGGLNPDWSGGSDPIANIPSFYLIVKGNIYIDPGVTQLDGVYIAQPSSSAAGGDIYTCYSGNQSIPRYSAIDGSLYGSCQNQLLINGAFVANQTYFDRAFGSLRDSGGGREVYSANTTKNCPYGPGDTSHQTIYNVCAAEIFNYTPELYLAAPNLPPLSGPTLNQYDDITSLAPVL